MYQDLFAKDILVIGCGNPLLGDDGFGPAVIESLEAQSIASDHLGLLDAGTSVRELLFDLLVSPKKLHTLILVDAVLQPNALPGDILPILLDQIPVNKVHDYSLHQFPTTNMLQELKNSTQIDIQMYGVQVSCIPEKVKPGLSLPVKKAVAGMCSMILEKINERSRIHADL